MNNKEYNDHINNKIEDQKVGENFKQIKQLYEETLFKNTDNKKRYYDDVNVEKIDASKTEEIKQLSNEVYLLKKK